MGLLADDPWGAAMWACAALAGVAVLWAIVALALRQPARGAARLLGLGTFGYLATATASAALRVAAAERAPAPIEEPAPEVHLSASEPTPPQPPSDAKADANAVSIDPSIAGPPQRSGKEALRFAAQVAGDERCKDARAVAGAVRDLAAAAGEPKARVDSAVDKLEGCRKKVLWVKAASIRRKRIEARDAWVEALKARMKSEGTPVFVSLRGAAHERMRLGGEADTIAKLRGQWDGTMRKELEALGFEEVVFANMKDSERFELEVPSDHQLAARELAPFKLDAPITAP
jgi:hypothetical protein